MREMQVEEVAEVAGGTYVPLPPGAEARLPIWMLPKPPARDPEPM